MVANLDSQVIVETENTQCVSAVGTDITETGCHTPVMKLPMQFYADTAATTDWLVSITVIQTSLLDIVMNMSMVFAQAISWLIVIVHTTVDLVTKDITVSDREALQETVPSTIVVIDVHTHFLLYAHCVTYSSELCTVNSVNAITVHGLFAEVLTQKVHMLSSQLAC